MSEIKLLPCPFCGKSAVVMSDVADCEMCGNFESDECPEYRKPEKDGCMQIVVCDVGKGGCGASGGWRLGREAAAEVWNRRAANTPCDVCLYNPPSSGDGKPCSYCPAVGKAGEYNA